MPLIESSFIIDGLLAKPHFSSIYPNLFRQITLAPYTRKRVVLTDGDFMDLDWSYAANKQHNTLLVLVHGLEGSTQSNYMKAMARYANEIGFDCVGVNLRGCSGEDNLLPIAYHSGKSDDLHELVNGAHFAGYNELALIGYSLGANLVLKYAGELQQNTGKVSRVVAISSPCDLESSAHHLNLGFNKVYLHRFLRTLKQKALFKLNQFPDIGFTKMEMKKAASFLDFDSIFTAPVHGFKNAKHYWSSCSSIHYIASIEVPTLIINALNDPFLPFECYPVDQCKRSETVFLEMPKVGGHVGFMRDYKLKDTVNWVEKRTLSFIQQGI